jgi:hypothetical protein
VRFIPWSESATWTQQDRLQKCSLATLKHRIELTKQHSTRAQHHDQHRPESLGQKHQARDVDGKSLTELLDGCTKATYLSQLTMSTITITAGMRQTKTARTVQRLFLGSWPSGTGTMLPYLFVSKSFICRLTLELSGGEAVRLERFVGPQHGQNLLSRSPNAHITVPAKLSAGPNKPRAK